MHCMRSEKPSTHVKRSEKQKCGSHATQVVHCIGTLCVCNSGTKTHKNAYYFCCCCFFRIEYYMDFSCVKITIKSCIFFWCIPAHKQSTYGISLHAIGLFFLSLSSRSFHVAVLWLFLSRDFFSSFPSIVQFVFDPWHSGSVRPSARLPRPSLVKTFHRRLCEQHNQKSRTNVCVFCFLALLLLDCWFLCF